MNVVPTLFKSVKVAGLGMLLLVACSYAEQSDVIAKIDKLTAFREHVYVAPTLNAKKYRETVDQLLVPFRGTIHDYVKIRDVSVHLKSEQLKVEIFAYIEDAFRLDVNLIKELDAYYERQLLLLDKSSIYTICSLRRVYILDKNALGERSVENKWLDSSKGGSLRFNWSVDAAERAGEPLDMPVYLLVDENSDPDGKQLGFTLRNQWFPAYKRFTEIHFSRMAYSFVDELVKKAYSSKVKNSPKWFYHGVTHFITGKIVARLYGLRAAQIGYDSTVEEVSYPELSAPSASYATEVSVLRTFVASSASLIQRICRDRGTDWIPATIVEISKMDSVNSSRLGEIIATTAEISLKDYQFGDDAIND
jgi:hypothetical protein